MALKIYRWRGNTYQIAEEDLRLYPGAEPVEPEKKAAKAPANKARRISEDKTK